jgi:hypothetical protein
MSEKSKNTNKQQKTSNPLESIKITESPTRETRSKKPY